MIEEGKKNAEKHRQEDGKVKAGNKGKMTGRQAVCCLVSNCQEYKKIMWNKKKDVIILKALFRHGHDYGVI